MADAIEVIGLRELQRALKRLDPALQQEVRSVGREAADIVARDARGRAPTRTGRLRGSIRTTSNMKGANVLMGRARVPYAGWIDFGGTIRFRTRRGALHRPYLSGGRILFPALEAKRDQAFGFYLLAVQQVVEREV